MMRRRIVGLAGATALALAAFTGTAVAAPPSCSSATNDAIFKTVNEAQYITASYGRGFTIFGSYYETCFQEPANNRTFVRIVHYGRDFGGGGNPEAWKADVYVYPSFVNCGGSGHNLDLGNVSWRYEQANGVVRTGSYATPCE